MDFNFMESQFHAQCRVNNFPSILQILILQFCTNRKMWGFLNGKKWCTRFLNFMDSLKIQRIAESWFPNIYWDFLIFLYNVSNIRKNGNIRIKIQKF